MLIPLVTLGLLCGFLYSGYQSHWFDILILGYRPNIVDVIWEIKAITWLAALLGWSLRNDLSVLWPRRGE